MKKNSKKESPHLHLSLVFIVIATIAVFYPSLGNNFVNWDDVVYIMNNDMIKTLNIDNLTRMFSSFFMGNYHPLTILSFAFDYSFFDVRAQGYHVHNLILHVINTVLVYFFTFHLLRKNELVAFIVTILFAIHPMHVESVAWVSERKDLLYTLYFLLAMLTYTFYCQKRGSRYLYITLLCYLLSLLSKAQAVTLPVVLLLIDYVLGRKPDLKMFLEKIPFFMLSLVFGYIAILAQKADGSVNSVGLSALNSISYAHYSIWVYLLKLILPVNLTCLYEYPVTPGGGVPFYIYLAPVIFFILLFIILKTWKNNPVICFGILFFLAVIFPVLQFLPVGRAIVAERYTYIPYIGLFFIIAVLFSRLRDKIISGRSKKMMNYAGAGIMLIFCMVTFNRTKVWADSVSLWTDVMEKNPSCMSAYINRSYMYIHFKQFDKAIRDCDDGLKIDSTQHKLYINRGTAYRAMSMYEDALKEFSNAIRVNPNSYESYIERGILYTDRFNKYDSAISDFRFFLKFRPRDRNGNFNLALAFYKNQTYDSSLYYCAKTMELAPDFADAYYISSVAYAAKNEFAKAYENGSKAQTLGYSISNDLLEGWRKKAKIVIPDLK